MPRYSNHSRDKIIAQGLLVSTLRMKTKKTLIVDV